VPGQVLAYGLARAAAGRGRGASTDGGGPSGRVERSRGGLHRPSPEAEDALVEYFRCISGEHPDWEEYRAAMRRQGKSLLRITPVSWGPVATGGFPPERAPA